MATTASIPDRGATLMVLMWVLTVVSSITIVMRLSIRARNALLGWDDTMMFLCMCCFYGWTIVLTLLCMAGGEKHIGDVNPDSLSRVVLLNWTSQVFGIIGIAAGKISVAALILAILKDSGKLWQRAYLWTFCVIIVAGVSVACSLLTFLQCTPAAKLWDMKITTGSCINPKIMADFGTFTGSYFAFVDASLSFIPTTIFWTLQISSHQKFTLSIIFALNILTCICASIKTSYLSNLANRTDLTWATYNIFAWVTAEFFLTAVCGTIPTLRPFFRFFSDRFKTTFSFSQSRYTRHTEDSKSHSQSGDTGMELQMKGLGDRRENSKATVESQRYNIGGEEVGTDSSVRGLNLNTREEDRDIMVEKSYQVRIESRLGSEGEEMERLRSA